MERPSIDQIRETVLEQRTRLVSRSDAGSELAGYLLGRLYLKHHIKHRRFLDAGLKWSQLVGSYCQIRGIPKPTPQACSMNANYGVPTVAELPEERISAIKDEYHSAYGVLLSAGREPLNMTMSVCINDEWPGGETRKSIGSLNAGLLALVEHFRIR